MYVSWRQVIIALWTRVNAVASTDVGKSWNDVHGTGVECGVHCPKLFMETHMTGRHSMIMDQIMQCIHQVWPEMPAYHLFEMQPGGEKRSSA